MELCSVCFSSSLGRSARRVLRPSHKQPILEELEASRLAPSGAVQDGRMRLRDGWGVPLLLWLQVLVAARYPRRGSVHKATSG